MMRFHNSIIIYTCINISTNNTCINISTNNTSININIIY